MYAKPNGIYGFPQTTPITTILTTHARDLGDIPLAVGMATDGGGVALDEALLAVVAHQGVDLITLPQNPEHLGVRDHRGLTAGDWVAQSQDG